MMFNDGGFKHFKLIKEMQDRYSNLFPNPLKELVNTQRQLMNSIVPIIDIPSPIERIINSDLFSWINKIQELSLELENNPEVQFIIITDLERLNIELSNNYNEALITDIPDIDIVQKEDIIDVNLRPYLERLNIDNLWIGANYALNSNINDNPDKLRHCLVSIRTILEHLINEKLASNRLLSESPMFERKFQKFREGRVELEKINIPRKDRIKYFSSKIEFGTLDEFTVDDIDFVYDCYSVLCDIHNPFISMTENQVRCLKMKTGVIIWLLAYLYEIIEKGENQI